MLANRGATHSGALRSVSSWFGSRGRGIRQTVSAEVHLLRQRFLGSMSEWRAFRAGKWDAGPALTASPKLDQPRREFSMVRRKGWAGYATETTSGRTRTTYAFARPGRAWRPSGSTPGAEISRGGTSPQWSRGLPLATPRASWISLRPRPLLSSRIQLPPGCSWATGGQQIR